MKPLNLTSYRALVSIYVDQANRVVYCDFKPSLINDSNNQLRKYVVRSEYLKLFIDYYQLRLHYNTIKTIQL